MTSPTPTVPTAEERAAEYLSSFGDDISWNKPNRHLYQRLLIGLFKDAERRGAERMMRAAIAKIDEIDDGEAPAYRHCQEAIRALEPMP